MRTLNSKYQMPNAKQIPNTKWQISNKKKIDKFGNYDLSIVWSLVLGFWDFQGVGHAQ